jgi:hypothetical protein
MVPMRPWLREVFDVPTFLDEPVEAVAIAEGRLYGVVRQVVRQKDDAERALLPL